MNKGGFIAVMLALFIAAVGAYETFSITNQQRRIFAFCGSVSKPALIEAAKRFEEKTGIRVELQFGGSGAVLSQLKVSKSGDLYIPGSHSYMFRAIKDCVVDPRTVKVVAYLLPAIIVQEGNPRNISSLKDLAKPGIRVGIGEPSSVCVGEYALMILKESGLMSDVGENIIVYAESCSKTASLVTIGQVDAIIGWRVFERWSPDKVDAIYIDPENIPRIAAIPAAISIYTDDRDAAQQFIDFLTSEEGREIYRKHGYITTLEEALSYAPYAETPKFEGVGG